MSDRLDTIWIRVKKMAGQCAANTDLEDLKASAKTAQGRIDKVLMGGKLLQSDSTIFNKLQKANEGLGAIGESLEKVQTICVNVNAAAQIHDAIIVLSDDQVIYQDPDAAAEAFDMLFQGFGKVCSYLPPPAKEWAQFFEQFNLFSNMQKKVYKPYFQTLKDARDGTGVYRSN
jgi:hypothetical protein